MTTTVQFPLTNQELYDLAQGELVRFPASPEEYWELLEAAEYRAAGSASGYLWPGEGRWGVRPFFKSPRRSSF